MTSTESTLRVTEVFHSIQGESTWAGLPCVFVRLTGCNLRCTWCDTAYAFEGGEQRTIASLLEEAGSFGTKLVEVTGGEPLAQKACPDLAQALLDAGFTVLIETSGSLPIHGLAEGVHRIMDLKCPDSGMADRNHWPNVDALDPARDEVKFVVASRRDYEWCRDIIREYVLEARCKGVLVSPVHGAVNARELAEWILADGLPVRFQLQLHKYIWDPDQRGV